jgi:hypothetical protein
VFHCWKGTENQGKHDSRFRGNDKLPRSRKTSLRFIVRYYPGKDEVIIRDAKAANEGNDASAAKRAAREGSSSGRVNPKCERRRTLLSGGVRLHVRLWSYRRRDLADAVAMPLKVTTCGLVGSVSTTWRDAEAVPGVLGANVTLNTHIPLAGMLPLHVLVWEKTLASGPVIVTLVIGSAVEPEFENVEVKVLVVPAVMVPKLRLAGE